VPDVSANGGVYVITVNGSFTGVLGTSASCPTVASIITIVNEQRKAQNKGPIGFLNPSFYNNPTMFTDITSGNTLGCGTNGFSAVPGW
jgi:tripeptidyl-peptidase-1